MRSESIPVIVIKGKELKPSPTENRYTHCRNPQEFLRYDEKIEKIASKIKVRINERVAW
ncbi:MAG: hypothetical protein QHH00_00550 [Methanomassiliicoccales archaeon]|jgi:hypothetical protein|nr:hypothetical protein [Methanomassiliicoccales archaeon]